MRDDRALALELDRALAGEDAGAEARELATLLTLAAEPARFEVAGDELERALARTRPAPRRAHPRPRLVLAFAVALVLGLVIGLANGAIVSYARINPLIATLATLAIIRGLGFVITGGEDLVISDRTYLGLGTNSAGGIPITVVILLVTFAAFGAVMPRTAFGRYAYAIGSNARAAKLAGVAVPRWRLSFYATCGVLAALAGLVTVARTGTAQPSANLGIELDVITAVILGGTSLTGGRGRLAGTFVGLLLIGTLNNGLILIDVQAYWQQVVKGMILLLAVFWDELRRTRRDED
jgi:ribose/xylose/arabinose/galactoside ABC-type transport system permease subunit